MARRLDRAKLVGRIGARLERFGYPRLRMLLLVCVTGLAGFLASFGLLHAGLLSMPLRYLAALAIAYVAFLVLLRAWLVRDRDADAPDGPDAGGSPARTDRRVTDGDEGTALEPAPSSGSSDFADLGGSGDELLVPVLLVVALVAIAFASIWLVATAPTLIAELLVDVTFSASLYHRLRGLETRHWLETAVRKTVLPFVGVAIVLVAVAATAQHVHPDAHTLGQALAASRR